MPRRAQVRFSSEGIRILRHGQTVESLAWDDYRGSQITERTWWIDPRFINANPTTVHIGFRDGADPDAVAGKRSWKLRDPAMSQIFASSKWEAGIVLKALCQYVAATPDARPGLDDPAKCERLVEALRSAGLEGSSHKHDRLFMGRKGEIRQAIDQAAEANMRYFGGRPVSGDRLLTADELAEITLKRLPTWIDAEWKDPERVRALAAEQLAIPPWPFGLLREG